MANILITGGAGFIGFHLSKYLSNFDNIVTIADDLSRGKFDEDLNNLLKLKNVSFKKIDLTNYAEYETLDSNFDFAYHLAAVNGTKYFYEMPEKLMRINILTTLNFLEWVTKTKCKNVMFSSSSEAYAGTISRYKEKIPTPEDIPLCIEDIFNPRFSYGGSKIAGELLFVNYAKKFQLRAKIVRFHNIYGPRMGYEHVIPEFCSRILRNENPFKIYGGHQTRAFCYVDDAVHAIRSIMEKSDNSIEIFHVGNDLEEISINDLADKMFQVTQYFPKKEIENAPEGSISRRCPSIEKLRSKLNYKPQVLLVEGLKKTFDWYKSVYEKNPK